MRSSRKQQLQHSAQQAQLQAASVAGGDANTMNGSTVASGVHTHRTVSPSPVRGRRRSMSNPRPARGRSSSRQGRRRGRSFSRGRSSAAGKSLEPHEDGITTAATEYENSVGSTLSTGDQFDIILPMDPLKLEQRRLAQTALRGGDDDVSSITTDEYRKYGGLFWRMKSTTCTDCLAPATCNQTPAIQSDITAPPLEGGHYSPTKHVNFENVPELQEDAAAAENRALVAQPKFSTNPLHAIFCGSPQTVQDDDANEVENNNNNQSSSGVDPATPNGITEEGDPLDTTGSKNSTRAGSRRRRLPRDLVVRKSDRSVDRSASLFDETLSEAEEREAEAQRGERGGRGWKITFPKGPWNRKRSSAKHKSYDEDAHTAGDGATYNTEQDSHFRPESRQGRESLAKSMQSSSRQGRDTPTTVRSTGTHASHARQQGRETPSSLASKRSSKSFGGRPKSRNGRESPAKQSQLASNGGGRKSPYPSQYPADHAAAKVRVVEA